MPEQDIEFDIPVRLRKWAGVVPVPPAVTAMEDAAYEVERLQRELTRAWAAARLTDEEREAIERGIDSLVGVQDMSAEAGTADDAAACTLRELIERTK